MVQKQKHNTLIVNSDFYGTLITCDALWVVLGTFLPDHNHININRNGRSDRRRCRGVDAEVTRGDVLQRCVEKRHVSKGNLVFH